MNTGGNLLDGIYNRNKIIIDSYKKGIPRSINFEQDILNISATMLEKEQTQSKKIENADAYFLNILENVWKDSLLKCFYDLGSKKLEINKVVHSDNQFKEEILHNAIEKFKRFLDQGNKIDNYGGYFFRTLFNTRMDHFRQVSKRNSHVDSDTLIERNELPQAAFTKREPIDLTRLDFIGTMVELKELKNSTVVFLLESFTGEFTQSPQVRFYQRKNLSKRITKLRKSIANPNTISTEKVILKDFEESEELRAISNDYKKGIALKNKATAFSELIHKGDNHFTKEELQLLVYINYTLASNQFDKVLEMDSTLFKSRYNLGFCLRRLGFTQQASMELDITLRFLENNPKQKNYNFKMAASHEFLAELNLIDFNLPEKALDLYQKAITFQPKDVNIKLGLMLAQFKLEQYDNCQITFKKILGNLKGKNISEFIQDQFQNAYKKEALKQLHEKFDWFKKEVSFK